MVVYKTPGVYKEEVFLRSQPPLPTGIPAFIGFADAIAALDTLPAGIQFPIELQNAIRYDLDKRRLVFSGIMTAENQAALLALSGETAYQRAIATLFQNGQRVVVLYRRQEFTSRPGEEFTSKLLGSTEGYLAEAVSGFFSNGGTQCFVVRAVPAKELESALTDNALFKALEVLNDLDLVAIPDAMMLQSAPQSPNTSAIIRVQRAMLLHCAAQGDRMAILDALPGSTVTTVLAQRQQLSANLAEPINGALYYPWLKNAQDYAIPDRPNQVTKGRLVPPCGHIAGIFARTDRDRGVFKAPANEELRDALDLELTVDNSTQDQLNPAGINCLRAFPGRGIRVWGARTLSGDVNWRYINVRRIFLTLGRWIDRNMLWATFEPSSPRLWIRIQRELSTYLTQLWQQGALQGATPDQAFYVKCDAETNPPEQREAGQVNTEIGLASNSTAEFIVVRIVHRAGTTDVEG